MLLEDSYKDAIQLLKNNELVQGLSDQQIKLLVDQLEQINVRKGEVFIKENDESDEVYFIKEGEVEIFKTDAETNYIHCLSVAGKGAVVGEIALIDNAPRSASVRAKEPSVLYKLDVKKLHDIEPAKNFFEKIRNIKLISKKEKKLQNIQSIIINNIAKQMTERLRTTNVIAVEALKKDLIQTKARIAMSKLMINTLIILSLYFIVMELFDSYSHVVMTTSYISIPLMMILAVPLIYMVLHSGYPLSLYGLTLKNWKNACIEALKYSIPFLVIAVLYKVFLIQTVPHYANRNIFDFTWSLAVKDQTEVSILYGLFIVFLYLVFVPVQELITRGIFQSSLQALLVGKHNTFWSILISNILFSDFHTHVSLGFGILVLIPGLFWGWLYYKQGTLVGVTLSHLVIGAWAIFIVGLI